MKFISLRKRFRGIKEKTKDEPEQTAALFHLIKFFALMIALTILSRGLAGASEAKVEIVHPTRQTISHRIETSGTLVVPEVWRVTAPEGMIVEELPLAPGDAVEAGAVLVRFGEEELDDAITRAEAQLQQLYVQYETLMDSVDVSDHLLHNATDSVNQAKEDLEDANAVKQQAESLWEQTLIQLKAAKEDLEVLKSVPPDQQDSQEIQEAEAQVQMLETMLAQAQSELEDAASAQEAAEDAVSVAEASLRDVRKSYEEALQQAQWTETQNKATAKLLELDIRDLEDSLDQLMLLKARDCCLLAEEAGQMVEHSLTVGSYTNGSESLGIALLKNGAYVDFEISKDDFLKIPGEGVPFQVQQGNISESGFLDQTCIGNQGSDFIQFQAQVPQANWTSAPVAVSIELSRTTSDSCVPLSALHADSKGYFVYVLEQKSSIWGVNFVAVRVDVTLEAINGEYAAVAGDLTIHNQIIATSNKPLFNGDRVRVEP